MRSPHEEITLIRQLMEDGRREVADRGVHYLIWGIASAVGLMATWLRVSGGTGPDPRWVWAGVLVFGWAGSVTVGRREGRRQQVATPGSRLLAAIWISVGVSITMIATAGMIGGILDPRALPGLISIVLAAPVLTMGMITPYRWLVAVAAGWWLGGAIMLALPGSWSLLMMAGMSLLLMALPGAVLYSASRRREGGARVLSEAQ